MIRAFDNSYTALPARFFAKVAPTKVREPIVRALNAELVELLALDEVLGLDRESLRGEGGSAILSGNAVPTGAASIALAYAGHQFGRFVPQLGDGRAILLGEIVGRDGARRDLQWKGAGPTPFSRNGDGRAALGPALREYLVSEAMAALGIPTTRALSVVTTGEPVLRDEPLPGAVLVRVARSHLRVGTFEYFAARRDREALEALTTYALHRHYPSAVDTGNDALALLDGVIAAHAELVARWLGVGFIHGVMNTDNTSISGETLDYGPCAFLDEYDPAKRFSSIDHGGRYAFANQPRIAQWNMACFAEALLPLLAPREEDGVRLATASLERFPELFRAARSRVMRDKLGLERAEDGDDALTADLFARMSANEVDHTLFFRRLSSSAADPSRDGATAALFDDPSAFHDWAKTWRARLDREPRAADARSRAMLGVNPAIIPRNHRVEEVLAAAIGGNFAPFEALHRALARPFVDPEDDRWSAPPEPEERVRATFCGT
ncbi:MAG: YdiU family protein [Polyangiaceae bacterium]